MKKLIIAASALVLPLVPVHADHHEGAETEADPWDGYRAKGNEPFWSLELDGDQMRFEHISVFSALGTRPRPGITPGGHVFYSTVSNVSGEYAPQAAAGREFIVLLDNAPCADSMAGTPYPQTVRVFIAGQHFSGCGGDSVDVLAGGPWTITHLMETPFTGDREISMTFDRVGNVSGSSGCNRYGASYTMDDGFSFGPIRSTRMACPGSVGENEQRIFTAMRSVISIDFESNGDLVLYSEHGPVLRLSR